MLLRIAQADAYAIGYEYVKNKALQTEMLKFEKFHQHPTYHALKPGCYTDDSQMSIAVSEVLIEKGPEAKAEDYAEAFFRCFKRDPRDGYSRALQAILEDATDASHMRSLIVPTSNKNGGCMRAVPVGVLKDVKQVMDVTATQAAVTHGTWGGINSSMAVALMSHFALYDGRSFASMFRWCRNQLPSFEYFKEPWEGRVGSSSTDKHNIGVGMCTAWAVHTLLTTEDSLMGMLKRTIEWGGDTDSVAAIAWGIASARHSGLNVPGFMYDDLEKGGSYGPAFLEDLGMRLMAKFV